MIEIVKMYLTDIDGRGTHLLTLVDNEGNEYMPESVDMAEHRNDVEFIKVAPNNT